VAIAHHLEDQTETILDRFLRGSGAKGLSGLREVQILKFSRSRPAYQSLAATSSYDTKEDLKDYLKSQNIAWREDLSNQTLDYRRNQIRHEVLPFLTQMESPVRLKGWPAWVKWRRLKIN
jgi:tRNA(Ile)-lysidine synthase